MPQSHESDAYAAASALEVQALEPQFYAELLKGLRFAQRFPRRFGRRRCLRKARLQDAPLPEQYNREDTIASLWSVKILQENHRRSIKSYKIKWHLCIFPARLGQR